MGIWNPYAGGPLASPVLLPDGSAAAPSLAFINSATTGLYRYAANVIGFTCNGVAAARITTAAIVSEAAIYAAATAALGWNGRGVFLANADGIFQMTNNATTDFGRLQFGGTTNAFPALKRSGTGLQFRLADDSNYTDAYASSLYGTAGGTIGFVTRSYIQSPADSQLLLINNAGTDFNRLQFGGTAATFPSLKRSTTEIHARLADDSANTDFLAAQLHVTADSGGAANRITFPYGYDEAARSTGVGTILFDDVTNRNSTGFLKIYVNGNARYVPYFSAI